MDFKYIIFGEGVILEVKCNALRVDLCVPIIRSEPVDHSSQNYFLCSSKSADKQSLSFLVCGFHRYIVDLLSVKPMNDPLCVMSYNFFWD